MATPDSEATHDLNPTPDAGAPAPTDNPADNHALGSTPDDRQATGPAAGPDLGRDPAPAASQAGEYPSGGSDDGRQDPAAPDEGFGQLGLAPAIAQSVADLGYETPTAVQLQCIPHLLAGRDLLGQAQTGTGKTAAFALPLLSRIDARSELPQVLVLTPTRELALQVAEAFQRYAQHLKGFHVLPIYGGQSYGLQVRQLQRIPQVVVGTPGRIMDHMRRETLSLGALKSLVLDEADEMLNMGFAEDIDWIFGHTPPGRQVALFSATMPPAILKVAREHLNDPVEIRVESATVTVEATDQQHCVVTRFHKLDVLTRILELESFDAMLIFVRTKNGTTELADKLRAHGFAAEPLNGDMNQEMRERTVERLKGGQLDILVATDVAARGLDVERISHVVNFDIPTDPSAYVHRIGRTGRAGRAGKAVLLVEPRERGLLRAIERTIRRSIPEMDAPSAAQLSASRIDRFTEQLRETLAGQDLDFFYRLIARITKEQEIDLLDVAAALSFQLQRERPLDVKEPPRERRPEPRREGGWDRERPRPQFRESRDNRGRDGDRPRFGPDRNTGERAYDRDRGSYRDAGERFAPRPERENPRFGRDSEDRGGRGGYEGPAGPRARDDRDPRPEDRGNRHARDDRPDDRGNRSVRDERPSFSQQRDDYRDTRPPREHREPTGGPTFQPERAPSPGGPRDERQDGRGPRPEHRGRGAPELIPHRIEVGHRDGVTPREIVGAIANESGLEGRFIGAIDIQDDYAIVDLPAGMPREIFAHLKRVYVRGRPLRISVLDAPHRPYNRPSHGSEERGPRPPGPRDGERAPGTRRFGPGDGGPGDARPSPGTRRKRRD